MTPHSASPSFFVFSREQALRVATLATLVLALLFWAPVLPVPLLAAGLLLVQAATLTFLSGSAWRPAEYAALALVVLAAALALLALQGVASAGLLVVLLVLALAQLLLSYLPMSSGVVERLGRLEASPLVVVARGGHTYHRAACPSLQGPRVTVTKREADVYGLTPCPRCRP